jgi:hypothetical protein
LLTLVRMVEPEDVILSQNDSRASLQNCGLLLDFPAIHIAQSTRHGHKGDDSTPLFKNAVLWLDVWPTQLDVLGHQGL